MEKEKKGLFARLLEFWKERIDGGGTDSIGFWNEKKKMDGGTIGVDVSVRGRETKLFRQEEEALTQEKKRFFTESENGRKRVLEAAEDPTRTHQKQKTGMLTAEIFREEKAEEAEKSALGKAFFRERSVEEREKPRNIIPVAEPVKEAKETEIEEERPLDIEEKRKDEKREEPQIDIEKLMRQMTKKLWEERESCGRRLR